jgi:hypothetical protein
MGTTLRYRRLAINMEVEQAFTRGLGYNLMPRLGLGVEWRPIGILPLRAGMSLGGRHGLVGAVGLGLDLRALVWEIGVANTGLTPGGVKGLGISTGLKISFGRRARSRQHPPPEEEQQQQPPPPPPR